jgi:hypothetical protein
MSPIASIPNQMRLTALIQEADLQKQILSEELQRSTRIADLHQGRAKEIKNVLGHHDTHYQNELLLFRRKLDAIERDCTDETLKSQLRRQVIAEGREATRKIPIEHGKIGEIGAKYNARLDAELRRHARDDDLQDAPTREDIIRLASLSEGPTTVRWPWHDAWMDGHDDKSPNPEGLEITTHSWGGVSTNGTVSAGADNHIIAGNFEHYWVSSWRHCEVRFPFKMPNYKGRVAALVELFGDGDNYFRHGRFATGVFTDSDSKVVHQGRYYLKVVGTTDVQARMIPKYNYSLQSDEDYENTWWVSKGWEFIPTGYIFSRDRYEPGQELYLAVGIDNYDYFRTNDMKGYSGFDTKWWITSVVVIGDFSPN